MDTFQEKLNAYIALFQKASDDWLNEERQKMNVSMNSFLIGKIKEAELSLKEAEKNHIEIFKNEMKKNEERKHKNTNPHMVFLFNKEEEFIKHQFETSMKFSKDNWQQFIENCKKEMR